MCFNEIKEFKTITFNTSYFSKINQFSTIYMVLLPCPFLDYFISPK
jgi:hypothetical protein